jgi:hypothetical protein
MAFGLVGFVISPAFERDDRSAPSDELIAAAQTFLSSLDEAGRAKAVIPLESAERFNWNYVPMVRQGLPLKEMTLEQRRAAHAMLRTILSSRGYLKATSIMQLEDILMILENNTPPGRRDRELYYFAIFGTPSPTEPWGWRVEGHHLSLNYTSTGNELSVTPSFFGSNPAEVRTGPMMGLRVLGAEEDIARDLVQSLDAQQRARAIIQERAPNDLVTTNSRRVELGNPAGLPASAMNETQRAILVKLIEEYAHNLRPDLAETHLQRIRAAGIDQLHFAWAGGIERGQQHYYRVHGPNVLFEYDNTQTQGNHIHSVWRDLENDFGDDLLRRHYEMHPH